MLDSEPPYSEYSTWDAMSLIVKNGKPPVQRSISFVLNDFLDK